MMLVDLGERLHAALQTPEGQRLAPGVDDALRQAGLLPELPESAYSAGGYELEFEAEPAADLVVLLMVLPQ